MTSPATALGCSSAWLTHRCSKASTMPQPEFDPSDFRIPSDVDDVRTLLTARAWERAAIVYAYVERRQGHRTSTGSGGRYSVEAFAALGIAGLRSIDTVRRYLRAWERAIELGWTGEVSPGDHVQVPDAPWPLPLDATPPDVNPAEGLHGVDGGKKPTGKRSGKTPPPHNPARDDYDLACQAQFNDAMRNFGRPFQQAVTQAMANKRFPQNKDAIAERHREQIEALIASLRKVVKRKPGPGNGSLTVVR